MLSDNAKLKDEVAGDIAKVNKAYSDALTTFISDDASGAIKGMRSGIDRWASDGTKAAASIGGKAPGVNGWSGWTKAGMTYLQGIEDLVDLGRHDTLDEITAQIKDIPAETVKQTKKAVKKVAQVATDTAHEAVHVAGAVGGFFTGLLGKVALGAGAVLVLLIVVRGK